MTDHPFRPLVDVLIATTNAGDADAVLVLFLPDAVIDDPSTGHRFDGHAGIRDYVKRYFKAYHTVTRFLSLNPLDDGCARLRVDFTGDFGHEIGLWTLRLATMFASRESMPTSNR